MISNFFTSNKEKVNAIKANKAKAKVNEKESEDLNFKLQFDGCSKSNPGLAGAGAVIYNVKNDELWNGSEFIGTKITNNHAEYMGLIIGLKQAKEMKIKQLIVEGDSMLVIKQMKGEYKVKSLHLIELYNEAKLLAKGFDSIHYNHIYRNNNKRADELSNIAVDNYLCKNAI